MHQRNGAVQRAPSEMVMIEGFDGPLISFMDLTQASISETWAALIKRKFDKAESRMSVVDVGCGTGLLLHSLPSEEFDLLGLDSSEEVIRRASLRLEARARLDCVDITRGIMPGAEAHLVVCVNGVANSLAVSGDLGRSLANMRRMMRPGGVLWIEVFTRDYLRQLADQLVVQENEAFSLVMRAIWLEQSGDLLLRLSGSVNEAGCRKPFDNLIRYRFVAPEELATFTESAGLTAGRIMEVSSDQDRTCWEFAAA